MKTDAIVLLPDHLHAIWTLPEGDSEYSRRWAWIKKEFTSHWLASGELGQAVTPAQARERRRGVLQPRFWEHAIRDESDFEGHFDYVHFNPVKHGYCQSPRDWSHSSIHRWAAEGVYSVDWGRGVEATFGAISATVGET